jgi:hypothetical protein
LRPSGKGSEREVTGGNWVDPFPEGWEVIPGRLLTAWLDQFPVPPIRPNGSSLVETMKAWRITAGGGWWTDFVQRTAQDATRFMEGEEDAEEKAWPEFERRLRVHRQALQRDVMSYLKGYYELG